MGGGAPFEALAEKHSICPSSKRGGQLGWVKHGMGLPPILEEAIFDSDVGEITTAETHKGLHIIEILAQREVADVQVISVHELEDMLKRGADAAQFIDVREEGEHSIAHLPHFKLLPLSKFKDWGLQITKELDKQKPVVCLCHAGMRSMQMGNFLVDQGFTQVYNVSGGIEAWSCQIDPTVPRY